MSDYYLNDPLKADGALTYLEFISIVKYLWERAHPDIPILPTQGKNFATYPCISYGLEYRKTAANETKKRLRHQTLNPEFTNIRVFEQRFENYVRFDVYTKTDPYLAESIIEEFERFMDKYTHVYKRLGLSEIVYGRRFPDNELNRGNQDDCVRAVGYLVTTATVTPIEYELIERIVADIRLHLSSDSVEEPQVDDSNIEVYVHDTYANATPDN